MKLSFSRKGNCPSDFPYCTHKPQYTSVSLHASSSSMSKQWLDTETVIVTD